MTPPESREVTVLLRAWSEGDQAALDRLTKISTRTIERDWKFAKSWLTRELNR